MTLWLIFALMTAAAIFAVLWPLGRREAVAGGSDLAVYRDQLAEIDRDRAAGLIPDAEAEAARVEVSRRLIAAADAAQAERPTAPAPLWRRRATAIAALIALPLGAAALYLVIGSPGLPGEPLGPRLAAIHGDRSIDSMIAQVEKHLEEHPDDVRGYAVLAPIYLRLGRFDDAVAARRKVLALAGENAERQSDLGEALTAAANGVVTEEAKTAFDKALALDKTDLKARFFSGLAAEQDGKTDKAADIWRGMLADAPPGANWAAVVRQALAQIGAAAPQAPVASAPQAPSAAQPGPNAADVAAASQMSEQDRTAMIHTMVARLADKLKQDGSDLAGWQRLVRAYVVLGERDKAAAAAADARHALVNDPDKLKQLEELLEGTGPVMTRKQRRLTLIGGSVAVLAVAVGLVLYALSGSIVFFNSPTDIVEKHPGPNTRIRLGGLVKTGSIEHGADLRIKFDVTDGKSDVPVQYQGVVPDLFREGQGVVAEGTLDASGTFHADTVLAKHDERYMPKEVVDALKKSGRWQEDSADFAGGKK